MRQGGKGWRTATRTGRRDCQLPWKPPRDGQVRPARPAYPCINTGGVFGEYEVKYKRFLLCPRSFYQITTYSRTKGIGVIILIKIKTIFHSFFLIELVNSCMADMNDDLVVTKNRNLRNYYSLTAVRQAS